MTDQISAGGKLTCGALAAAVSRAPFSEATAVLELALPTSRSAMPSLLGSGSEAAVARALASDLENVVARLPKS